MVIPVTVTASSHPDFDMFASVKVNGRQLSKRGSMPEIDEWISALREAAATHGHEIKVING